MIPIALDSREYRKLRTKWVSFDSDHGANFHVIEGEQHEIRDEIERLSTHWKEHSTTIRITHPYDSLPMIFQLEKGITSYDVITCKNILLRFRSFGWHPGGTRWILVEIGTFLRSEDLDTLFHILYRQQLQGGGVLLFFCRSSLLDLNTEEHWIPISLNRDASAITMKKLKSSFRKSLREDKHVQNSAYFNLLSAMLLAKSDVTKTNRYAEFLRFFRHHGRFQQLSSAQRMNLWFELAQLLTKKENTLLDAQQCYTAARESLQGQEMHVEDFLCRHAALDNGEALIQMMQGHLDHALELEIRGIRRMESIPDTGAAKSLRLQAFINIAGLYLKKGDADLTEKYLLAAQHLAFDSHSGWQAKVLQMRMQLERTRGWVNQERMMLKSLLQLEGFVPGQNVIQRSVELAGEMIREGELKEAADVYRRLIQALPTAQLSKIRKIHQALCALKVTNSDTLSQLDARISSMEQNLLKWDRLKEWNGRRALGVRSFYDTYDS